MDDAWHGLMHELDELNRIRRDIVAIRDRDDQGRLRDLVALRRRLSAQIAALSAHAAPLFGRTASAALSETYLRLRSDALSKVALHQADWPAVMLGRSDQRYVESARGVDLAIDALCDWLRQQSKSH